MPWLSLAILFPIVCAVGIFFLPEGNKVVKWYSLGVTLITFLITVAGYLNGYDPDISGLQMAERYSWVPQLGLTWSVGADGLSMPLILLLVLLQVWQHLLLGQLHFKPKLFYFFLLLMDGGQIMVFRSTGSYLVLPILGIRTYSRLHDDCYLGW